ncbi:phenylacetate-coenzyme A ligase PaaK-like adenylate-forming protein [Allocatelliglobosispora scoriae]|uniref:Phenylacetate-coenzyme A ligase PaaK-like adenylate-forming protein n=1 Tax=Allocatelliglobosispora scoriae TaxID=643052 RepID=A0A841BYE9_9ACTN|nr:hypothetical protein [Allocatelliglobosispora scoriae]MBB5874177.1 phenylacetate-coenzyme A ligase PaaK-like adenylate-forming protein [Allocatelliglobosispora scoriae]
MTRLPRSIPILPVLTNLAIARSRDRARPEALAPIQADLLRRLVRHAAANVPHYRDTYDPAIVAALAGPADLAALPTLTRRAAADLGPARLLADGLSISDTRTATTSGSTGEPATFCYSEHDMSYLRATYLWDMLACGMRPTDRVGYFRVGGFRRHRLEKLGLARNVHVNTSLTVAEQTDAFLAGRPTLAVGFPTAIAAVAAELRRRGIFYPHLRTVIFAGEPTLSGGRDEVLDYFGATGHEVYASVEAYTIARSCRRGSLHLRSGDVVVEVLGDDGTVTVAEGTGEIVVTRLRAEAMPLIRYRLGDRVEIVPDDCDCGDRFTPVVRSVLGRVEDRIVTLQGAERNGDFISSLINPVTRDGVLRLQFVQDRPGALRICAMVTPGREELLTAAIERVTAPARAEFDIEIEIVDAIPLERNGKIRLVKRLW